MSVIHIIDETPDIVINVVDSSNLERNLYLTTQLIDMNVRMVMALNMYDELEASGNTLDYMKLSELWCSYGSYRFAYGQRHRRSFSRCYQYLRRCRLPRSERQRYVQEVLNDLREWHRVCARLYGWGS